MAMRNYVKSFLLFSIISIIAVPFAVYDQVTRTNLLLLIVIGFGISCIAAATFFGLLQLLRIFGIGITNANLVIILVIAGALRGIVMHASINEIGLIQPTSLIERVFASIATTVVWVQIFAWMTMKFDQFNERYAGRLQRKLMTFVSAVKGNRTPLNSKYIRDVEELDALLKKTLDPVSQQQYSREDLLSSAERLRNYVQEVVRPLSREIWLTRDSMPRFHRSYLLKRALKQPQLKPLPTASFIAGLVLSNLAVSQSLFRGMLATVIIFSLTLPTYQLIDRLNRRAARGVFANSILFLFPGILSGFIFLWINKSFFDEDSGIFSWFAVIVIFGVGVIAAMLSVVALSHAQLIQELDRSSMSPGVDDGNLQDVESEKLASYLHNTLQSELLALSFQMEQIARNPAGSETQGVLEKIQSTLKRSLTDHFYETQLDPIKRLEKLASSWSGLLEVELAVELLSKFRDETQSLVVATIEESITNAFRHGGATQFRATLTREDLSSVKLSLWSNSVWSDVQGSGLGQQWILDNCISMSKERSDSGSKLVILFPATEK